MGFFNASLQHQMYVFRYWTWVGTQKGTERCAVKRECAWLEEDCLSKWQCLKLRRNHGTTTFFETDRSNFLISKSSEMALKTFLFFKYRPKDYQIFRARILSFKYALGPSAVFVNSVNSIRIYACAVSP